MLLSRGEPDPVAPHRPMAVVSRQCPEVSCPGLPLPRLRHRGSRLIHVFSELMFKVPQVTDLSNILEQVNRFIKQITEPMLGYKASHTAAPTLVGIEAAHMIRTVQFDNENQPSFQICGDRSGRSLPIPDIAGHCDTIALGRRYCVRLPSSSQNHPRGAASWQRSLG